MSSGKSSSGQTVYWGWVLCEGCPGRLRRIYWLERDGTIIWKSKTGLVVTGNSVTLDTDIGTVTIHAGTQTQQLSSRWSDEPDHRGKIMIEGYVEYGTERDTPPSFKMGCNVIVDGLVSPLEAVRELWCNSDFGLGLDENSLSFDSDLIEETRFFSYSIDGETSFSEFLDDALPLAFFTWRFEHQKLNIIRQFTPPNWDDVPHVNQDNWIESPTIKPETPTERVNQTIVKYREFYNSGTKDDNTDGIYDNANVWIEPTPQTGIKQTTIQAESILDQDYSAQFTAAKGHQLACSLTTGSVSIRKQTFSYDETSIHQPICVWCQSSNSYINARVTDQTICADENRIDLDWEMDTTSSIHEQGSLGYEASTFTSYEPEDPRAVLALELPRPLADQTAMGLFVARGNSMINGYGISTSLDGANFVYSARSESFSVYGQLTGDLDDSGNELSLDNVTLDQSLLESVSVAQAEADEILGVIGTGDRYEFVSVQTITQTAETTFDLTVLRGRFGTVKISHDEDSDFFMIRRSSIPVITSQIAEPNPILDTAVDPTAGVEYLFHLPQRIISNVQDAGDCEDVPGMVVGAYARPLPPQDLVVSSSWTLDSGDMTLAYELIAWRDEGYPGADFYETESLLLVPVVVTSESRYVLPARSQGQTTCQVTLDEVTDALGYYPGVISLELFTYYNGRHSRIGTSITLELPGVLRDSDGKILLDSDGKILREA